MDTLFGVHAMNRSFQNEGDYINCPFNTRKEYEVFINELTAAERISLREFESEVEKGVQGGKGKVL